MGIPSFKLLGGTLLGSLFCAECQIADTLSAKVLWMKKVDSIYVIGVMPEPNYSDTIIVVSEIKKFNGRNRKKLKIGNTYEWVIQQAYQIAYGPTKWSVQYGRGVVWTNKEPFDKQPRLCLNCTGRYIFSTEAASNDMMKMMDTTVVIAYQQAKDGALNRGQSIQYLENIYLMDGQKMPLNYLSDSVNKLFKFINIYEEENRELITEGIYTWDVVGELHNDIFIVRINDWNLKYHPEDKVAKYHFSTSGGSEARFRYDCNKRRWVFVSIRSYGI